MPPHELLVGMGSLSSSVRNSGAFKPVRERNSVRMSESESENLSPAFLHSIDLDFNKLLAFSGERGAPQDAIRF